MRMNNVLKKAELVAIDTGGANTSSCVKPIICENVLHAIGATPLVRISKFMDEYGPQVFVKLEALNPGGSSKDRAAREIILSAAKSGLIQTGGKVIVSTSGNMGVGLAMVCAYMGYELHCVVDPKISSANEVTLRVLGATILKVEEVDEQGGYFLTRLRQVEELKSRFPNALYIDQYDSCGNVHAHYSTTANEIIDALNGQVDAVVIAAGTGGTIMGTARCLKEKLPSTEIWAVDEYGSIALPSSSTPHKRYLNGLGTGIRPANYDYANFSKLVDKQCHVTAAQAIGSAVDLARSEGILAGGSGGAVLYVMKHLMANVFGPSKNIVGILPDHGSRYTDTIFNEDWLSAHGIDLEI